MDDFVEFIAKSLVDDPTQVEVREYRQRLAGDRKPEGGEGRHGPDHRKRR